MLLLLSWREDTGDEKNVVVSRRSKALCHLGHLPRKYCQGGEVDILKSREKVWNNCVEGNQENYRDGNRNILEHSKDSDEVEQQELCWTIFLII